MEFTDLERDYLSTQRLGRLATVGPAGDPQNNPVGFHLNDELGTIDIRGYTMESTRKFRNIQKNDQVSLVIDDIRSTDPWRVRGIEIRGRAEALTDAAPPDPHMSSAIIRIHPHTIFTWGLDDTSPGMTKRTA